MTSLTRFLSIATAMFGVVTIVPSAAFAQTAQEHEQHHRQGSTGSDAQAEPAPVDKGAGHSGTQKGGMMGGDMMGRMMQGGMEMKDGCPMMGMMAGADATPGIEDRVASLKSELAITNAQNKVWSAYATAIKKDLETMQGAHEMMMKTMGAQSPVQRLDGHLIMMERRVAALKEVKPALSNLYAALDDNQKKAANKLLTGMGCMM
ncbi:MAG TPA: Spy/CpxP family protein refolding chaperone [Hyphomicrobium sp.]|uniref:Spy/CpxP family protein refolding chaperone n=1 Tax=Hyphomicrobium sp. TaxID=82 RepID=UPI002C36D5C0|nr:Spy/CpxP family protein refolding chaperone [Hyphomicrobium sp.]HRN87392.1 Spy/CpxP family protein refolding chaperone [Hyphomicrobium sp.]